MKKNKALTTILLSAVILTTLAACGEKAPEEVDLSGQWKQVNGTDIQYHGAVIDDGQIEIYWVSDDDDSRSLYWSGSFTEPVLSDANPGWISSNNTARTSSALLASMDSTKEFFYSPEKHQISYSASMMGITKTIRLEREDWSSDVKIKSEEAPTDRKVSAKRETPAKPDYHYFNHSVGGFTLAVPDYYTRSKAESTEQIDAFTIKSSRDAGMLCFELPLPDMSDMSALVDKLNSPIGIVLFPTIYNMFLDEVVLGSFDDFECHDTETLSYDDKQVSIAQGEWLDNESHWPAKVALLFNRDKHTFLIAVVFDGTSYPDERLKDFDTMVKLAVAETEQAD